MQAMIFAAGLGTRLKPLTDTCPKALVSVGGCTLLERTLRTLQQAGCERTVVNVHHFSSQIVSFLDAHRNFGLDISVSDESCALLDTGGGLKKAQTLFAHDAPILIHNVDIVSNAPLAHLYARAQHTACGAMLLVSTRKTTRYLLFDQEMRLCGWTNTETGEIRTPYPHLNIEHCTRLAFSGIHVFSPALFQEMNDFPDKFGIIDFYLSVCRHIPIMGFLQEDLQLVDVGKFASLAEAEQQIAEIEKRGTYQTENRYVPNSN